MDTNLEYFRVFYHVAKHGSLAVAADELSVSQPAVSQQLRHLERDLGAELFNRTSRGVKLTKEGELLYGYVKRGVEQIELGEKKLRQMLSLELGELHIGASDMTLKYYLLPFLERFHEGYPEIKVTVNNAPTPETLDALSREIVDFAVVSGPVPETPGIEFTPVREIQDTFVAARRFIQYKNRTLDFGILEQLPLICLEGRTSSRTYMDQFMARSKVTIRPEFELATSDMIVQFALRNLGVGSVVRDFAKEYLDSGQLFELRFSQVIPRRKFYIAINTKSALPVAARRLLELIREESGKD